MKKIKYQQSIGFNVININVLIDDVIVETFEIAEVKDADIDAVVKHGFFITSENGLHTANYGLLIKSIEDAIKYIKNLSKSKEY